MDGRKIKLNEKFAVREWIFNSNLEVFENRFRNLVSYNNGYTN